MSRQKNRRIVWAVLCVVLAALGGLSLSIRSPYLVLTNTQTNRLLYAASFHEGETFAVSHVHSLHQSPVTEIYAHCDGQILLVALEFESFGAGLPEVLEYGQTLTRLETGGLRIDGMERPMPDFHVLIGHTAEHTLHIADRNIPLDALDDPGQSVQFSIRQLNIWQRLFDLV